MKREPDEHIVEVVGNVFTVKRADGANFKWKKQVKGVWQELRVGETTKYKGKLCTIIAIQPNAIALQVIGGMK